MKSGYTKGFTILYSIIWPFFQILFPSRVVGRENIPEGAALICPNHSALTDPFFVAYAFTLRHKMRVIGKAELFHVPVLGFLLKKAGIFGVERGKSDIGAIKECMRILKSGDKLLMFPEGTRVKESGGGQAKAGAAMLATRTGVPIVPVYVPRDKKMFRKITVVIGAPYVPEFAGKRPTSEEYDQISSDLMARIEALGA